MFSSLLDILRKVQRENPVLQRRLAEAEALSRWESAVGPQIARHARAVRVQERTLYVEVDHPIWKQELQNRKRQILDKLNALPPREAGAAPEAPLEDLYFFDARAGGAAGPVSSGSRPTPTAPGRSPRR